MDAVHRHVEEEAERAELAAARRALHRDRDPLAVDGRVSLDRPMDRLRIDQLLIRLPRPTDDRPCVEGRHLTTFAAVEVHRVAPPAQRLDVLVDEVGAGGGRAPGVVDAAPEEDPERDARERRAARAVATAVEVELEHDLRVVLPHLRPGDEERLTGCGALRPDEERVRHGQAGGGRGEPGRGGRRGREVDHDVPDLARAVRVVRHPPWHGDVGLGIVPLAEVLPDTPAGLLPELALEEVEELGAAHLVAPSGSEDGAHQPADRDDVVARPRCDREPGSLVLGVDAGDVGVDDPDRLAALRPLRPQQRELLAESRLRRRARPELPPGQCEAEGVHARRVERGDAARAAQ